MIKYKNLLILFIFFIFLTSYNPFNKYKNKSLIFPIKKIIIGNNKIIKQADILRSVDYLKNKNIFFIDMKKISKNLSGFDFIESFNVKKIFPNTIKINIIEKRPVAIHFRKKKKFYISNKGDLIKYDKLDNHKELLEVFGEGFNFKLFFEHLETHKFPINQIKSLYYYEIGRWDINLKNGRVIKLPKEKYIESINNFIKIKDDNNFTKFKLFDYRIKKQLILK
jgi:cell division protein FtsQ|tara:strand:- start:464 stop:1132 length:669 start_codon:yes stop_codon:yes gene_type:complete